MRKRISNLLVVAVIAALVSCEQAGSPPQGPSRTAEPSQAAQTRPAQWAQPIEARGLPNLHKVSDALYRGAQPEDEGFAELKALGIKTVVNLRTLHSDRDECREAGLEYVHITVQAWEGETEEVIDFLKVATDPARQPVFVHCQHGADRTGTMCAIYRIVVEGWSKEETLQEMTEGGFGFHSVWQNLIKYIRELDIESLKSQAGL